jgi:hypothetical protein
MITFDELRWANITGIVDSNGAAHSILTKFGENIPNHDEHWPNQTHCR